jgi:hypothetical protein
MRLEPGCRNPDMSAGLQARIYDPLWLMARQWQMGEFQGEDNGSPAIANLESESSLLTRFQAGAIPPNTMLVAPAFDSTKAPLETIVEREQVRPADAEQAHSLRLAVEAGMYFLRLLEAQMSSRRYRDEFTRTFVLTAENRSTLDSDSRSYLDLMAGRCLDGRRLYAEFNFVNNIKTTFPVDLQIVDVDESKVQQAVLSWLSWYESLFSEPDAAGSCWLNERMEYGFTATAPMSGQSEMSLTAQEYSAGNLDWYDFDVNGHINLGAFNDTAISQIVETVIPATVTFRGAPAQRFWEFEDAQVDFGSVNARPEDLARMLLIEFTLNYGNDWFVIPVDLPVGSVCRTLSLVVTNTFGERFVIPTSQRFGEPVFFWQMFRPSALRKPGDGPFAHDVLFLPPALVKSLESRPLEEVLFLRDEMANMAWGVERVIESAIGFPLNRFEQPSEDPQPPPQSREKTVFKLATEVPDNWVPLMPVRSKEGLRLRRAKMLKLDRLTEPAGALGQILNPNRGALAIFEEEIPREGIRVTRHYQLARWQDGSTHLWIGRKKKIGRGEGSSGLKFDSLLHQ